MTDRVVVFRGGALPTTGVSPGDFAAEVAARVDEDASLLNLASAGDQVRLSYVSGDGQDAVYEVVAAQAALTLGAGQLLQFAWPGGNTGAGPTLTIGAAEYTMLAADGGDLAAADLRAGSYVGRIHSGTVIRVLNLTRVADVPGLGAKIGALDAFDLANQQDVAEALNDALDAQSAAAVADAKAVTALTAASVADSKAVAAQAAASVADGKAMAAQTAANTIQGAVVQHGAAVDLAAARITGAYIHYATGVQTSVGNYDCAVITVTPGEYLKISGYFIGSVTALAVWRSAGGAYIGHLNRNLDGTPSEYADYTLLVPAGVGQLCLSWPNTLGVTPRLWRAVLADDLGVSVGRQSTALVGLADALSRPVPVALAPTVGAYIGYSSGAITAVANYAWAAVPVTPGETITVSGHFSGTVTALVVWKSPQHRYLSYADRQVAGVTEYTDHPLTVPAGAGWAYFCWPTSQAEPVIRQRTVVAVAEDLRAVADSLTAPLEMDEYDLTLGRYIHYATGNEVELINYDLRRYDVSGKNVVYISGQFSGAVTALAVFKDGAGTYLGYDTQQATGVIATHVMTPVAVPDGAAWLYVTWPHSADAPTVYCDAITPDVARDLRVMQLAVAQIQRQTDYWAGRTAVWFGTSIPAGGGAGGRYPSMVAEALGMTIYNEASGGSGVRAGYRSLITGSDPMGITGATYRSIARSLSQTLAEKQWLFDNWATVKTQLAPAVDNPDTVDSSHLAEWQDHSYERRLVERHLGANRRDLYVFDHGHNDRLPVDDIATAGAGSRDRFTFLGGINYLIDLILDDNPKAKIMFVGHYENARKASISEAQIAAAEYRDRPLIRLWEALGWTQQTVQTTGEWVSGVWDPDYHALPVARTMTQIWLSDDLHPHTDLSGDANMRIADIIATRMMWVR
ncbi:hypothetical protein [uncultured Gemmobacter sp.]|uniref:hypothetical protein n=1 Tax=uncultured Gemmobacter sp. TaxID=1095917 RepID=UPI000A5134A0|nr:hypothetical protein [uncultured Gemmobacter sp.]